MIAFDRRSVITAAVATGTALCVPGTLRAAARSPGVFVVDRRFAASAAAASDRAAVGAMVIDPRREDLGIAWRKRIPQWLDHNGGVIEGVTLWTDLVICQAFARDFRLALVLPPEPVQPVLAPGLQRWMLAERGFKTQRPLPDSIHS